MPPMLNLGPRARVVFCAAYVAAQISLLAFGLRAPDHVFGFQMFNESSRVQFQLFRKVRGKRHLLPVVDDAWEARDRAGRVHRFRWNDRVRYYVLGRSGVSMHASCGLDAQLFRLQAALDHVLAHIPADTRTQELTAVVHASLNGRPNRELRLTGKRRWR
jgi:hypothetical protein